MELENVNLMRVAPIVESGEVRNHLQKEPALGRSFEQMLDNVRNDEEEVEETSSKTVDEIHISQQSIASQIAMSDEAKKINDRMQMKKAAKAYR